MCFLCMLVLQNTFSAQSCSLQTGEIAEASTRLPPKNWFLPKVPQGDSTGSSRRSCGVPNVVPPAFGDVSFEQFQVLTVRKRSPGLVAWKSSSWLWNVLQTRTTEWRIELEVQLLVN